MCSLVKWSVRLNDLSDFGVTDEIDLEGGRSWTIYQADDGPGFRWYPSAEMPIEKVKPTNI